MRYFLLTYILLIVLVIGVAGFQRSKSSRSPIQIFNDMDRQAKGNPQMASDFFPSGQLAQEPVPGTIPMGWEVPAVAASAGGAPNLDGYAFAQDYLNTGKMGEYYGDGIPEEIPVDEALLRLGREKFNTYCAICHGESGDGAGVTSKYGVLPANLTTVPVADPAQRPDGSIYDVMVNGRGNMSGYGDKLTLRERWAVVGYVRTLQQRVKMPAAEAKEAYEAWQAAKGDAQ